MIFEREEPEVERAQLVEHERQVEHAQPVAVRVVARDAELGADAVDNAVDEPVHVDNVAVVDNDEKHIDRHGKPQVAGPGGVEHERRWEEGAQQSVLDDVLRVVPDGSMSEEEEGRDVPRSRTGKRAEEEAAQQMEHELDMSAKEEVQEPPEEG